MYTDEQVIQFSDDKKTLLHFPSNLVGVYIIPEGLEEIAEDAFAYTDLTAIAVPEGVTSIGAGAFDSNAELKHLFLPSTITRLNEELGVFALYPSDCVVYVPKGHAERIRALDPTLKSLTFVELTAEEMIERPKALKEQFRIQWEAEQESETAARTAAKRRYMSKWKKRVAQIKNACANGANTLEVHMEASYGFSCWGGAHGTEGDGEISVSKQVLDTLLALMEAKEPMSESEFGLDYNDIDNAIEAGHTELQQLHEELVDRFYYMDEEYWLFEADNECIDESLEPYFYQDVEDGLYEPETDEDYDPESGYEPDSFEACRDNYLEWVNSHRDDHYFVADRVGVDLSACREDDPYYIITGIK